MTLWLRGGAGTSAKVLVYVTHRGRLLVLRHPDSTDAGAQVPGGSVEPGEELAAAALREAREETGLAHLVIERFLGMATYVPRVLPGPPHLRHFFHASLTSNVPDAWDHVEATPSTGGPPIRLLPAMGSARDRAARLGDGRLPLGADRTP